MQKRHDLYARLRLRIKFAEVFINANLDNGNYKISRRIRSIIHSAVLSVNILLIVFLCWFSYSFDVNSN